MNSYSKENTNAATETGKEPAIPSSFFPFFPFVIFLQQNIGPRGPRGRSKKREKNAATQIPLFLLSLSLQEESGKKGGESRIERGKAVEKSWHF